MVLKYLLSLLLCCCLFSPLQLWAADSTNTGIAQEQEAQNSENYPGLSSLGIRTASINDFAVKAEESLIHLAAIETQNATFEEAAARLQKLTEEMDALGSPDSWYVDRLTNYNNQYLSIRQNVESLLAELSTRQQEIESLREEMRKRSEFWIGWNKYLLTQDLTISKQTLSNVTTALSQLEEKVKSTSSSILALQEKSGILLSQTKAIGELFGQALNNIRKATFRKNSFSFFSAKFYEQFDITLFPQLRQEIKTALTINKEFFDSNSWKLGMMLVVFVSVSGLVVRYRHTLEKTSEWHFVLQHPFAAAIFLAVLIFWLWLPAPPVLYRFVVFILTVASAAILTSPILENRRQRRVLLLVAIVASLTSMFQFTNLPQPLFRLYISLLTITLVPFLVKQVRSSTKECEPGEGRLFRSILRSIIVVMIVSLLGQIFGYVNFSAWLIESIFDTGVIALIAKMTQLLIFGGIDLGNHLLSQQGFRFFKWYGLDLSGRIKKIVKVIIFTQLLFQLLPVWRIFSSAQDGWDYFSELALSIGDFSLSLQMVITAFIVLYLSLQLSWLIQKATESHLMEGQSADRGVCDAVKKLIHYAIMLLGFLLALSYLGFGLKNLIVILGAFGIGIGFGLQDIVNNFLSGIILLFERPIKVGDGVMIDDEYGTVTHIGLRSTIVENLDQAELIVPNAHMISEKVTNWTFSARRVRIVITVGVAYGSDLDRVLHILKSVGASHPDVMKTPQPVVYFNQFGESSLDFELRTWINNVDDRPRIKHELLLSIDKRFREEGIEIPFPQRDLYIRSVASKTLEPQGLSEAE
jgi:small-conductance mechanosensitive channel